MPDECDSAGNGATIQRFRWTAVGVENVKKRLTAARRSGLNFLVPKQKAKHGRRLKRLRG